MDQQTILAFMIGLTVYPIFWVLLAAVGAGLAFSVAREDGFFTTACTAGLGLMAIAKWPQLIDVFTDPIMIALGVAIYAIAGIIWSRIKWGKFVNEKFDIEVARRNRFIQNFKLDKEFFKRDVETLEYVDHLNKYASQHPTAKIYGRIQNLAELNSSVIPTASSNKASIVMWIAYWPLSLTFYLFADLLSDFGNFIYSKIGGYFQAVATNKFEKL